MESTINPNHHQRIIGCNISTYRTVSHISHFSIWIIWSIAWGRINQRCLLVSHKQKSNTLWKHQPFGKKNSTTSFKQLNFKRFGCFRLLHFETAKIVYWKHHSHYSLGISNLVHLATWTHGESAWMKRGNRWGFSGDGSPFQERLFVSQLWMKQVENGTLIISRCAEWRMGIFFLHELLP